MKTIRPITLFLAVALFTGCPPDNENDAATGDAITLDDCETSFGDGVQAFYSTYFSCVTVSVSGTNTLINSDNLPPHVSWYYSDEHGNYIDWASQGDGYYLNPNMISTQDLTISIPNEPTSRGLTINGSLVDGEVGNSDYEYDMSTVGLALDGCSLFNPLAAPGDDIEDEKYSFDLYSGHPEMTGNYHYHTTTKGPLEVLEHKGLIQTPVVGSAEIELYGIMCDGTLIMGCTELDGSTPDNSDFDSQNGHVHDISDGTTVHFSNRYHTHICTETFTSHSFTPEIQYYEGCN